MNKFFIFIITILIIGFIDYKINRYKSFYNTFILKEINLNVLNFIQDINPELAKKMDKIKKEIYISEKKIKELKDIQYRHKRIILDKALNKWSRLHENLVTSYQDIYAIIENSYILFKIDEIGGHQSFKKQYAYLNTHQRFSD